MAFEIGQNLQNIDDITLRKRLMADYKDQKAYSYFASGCMKEIQYHPITPDSKCRIEKRNNDNMCCRRAIVTGICRIENHLNWDTIRQGYKEQREYAVDMYRVHTGGQLKPLFTTSSNMRGFHWWTKLSQDTKGCLDKIWGIEKHLNWNTIRQGYKGQREYAVDMYRKAGIPVNTKCGIAEIKQIESTECMAKYRVVFVSREHIDFIIYAGPEDRDNTIYLYVHNVHITSMHGFLRSPISVKSVLRATAQRTNVPASMPARCAMTVTAPPPPSTENDEYKRCTECNRNFKKHRANKVCECFFLM